MANSELHFRGTFFFRNILHKIEGLREIIQNLVIYYRK